MYVLRRRFVIKGIVQEANQCSPVRMYFSHLEPKNISITWSVSKIFTALPESQTSFFSDFKAFISISALLKFTRLHWWTWFYLTDVFSCDFSLFKTEQSSLDCEVKCFCKGGAVALVSVRRIKWQYSELSILLSSTAFSFMLLSLPLTVCICRGCWSGTSCWVSCWTHEHTVGCIVRLVSMRDKWKLSWWVFIWFLWAEYKCHVWLSVLYVGLNQNKQRWRSEEKRFHPDGEMWRMSQAAFISRNSAELM